MPTNQIIIAPDFLNTYYYDPRDRYFSDEPALLQHCNNANVHATTWCNRCNVLFVHSNAKQDHLKHASNHNICDVPGCGIDFLGTSDYREHFEVAHDGCWRCGKYGWGQDLWNHKVYRHNMCNQCGEFFNTENELRMHGQVHYPRNKGCYGCHRLFPSHSAVLIHLESGTCPSQIRNKDIIRAAFEYYDADEYTNNYGAYYRFRCPACDAGFRFVSALFQHVEHNKACGQGGYQGSVGGLRDELERNIYCQ